MATIDDIIPTADNVFALIGRLSPEEQKRLEEKLGAMPPGKSKGPDKARTLEDLFGAWKDDNRTAEEMIQDIYESRTLGRDIDL